MKKKHGQVSRDGQYFQTPASDASFDGMNH
jgi:hypothetical protein